MAQNVHRNLKCINYIKIAVQHSMEFWNVHIVSSDHLLLGHKFASTPDIFAKQEKWNQ
jgi:hypothetical protein